MSRGKTNHPLHKAFIEAGQQAGYPFTDDMNGYQQEGLGWMDMTVHKGSRKKETTLIKESKDDEQIAIWNTFNINAVFIHEPAL